MAENSLLKDDCDFIPCLTCENGKEEVYSCELCEKDCDNCKDHIQTKKITCRDCNGMMEKRLFL